MSERGLCSRREAGQWIARGRVRVGGKRIDKPGTRVPPDAQIEIDCAPAFPRTS